jgi:hypothetical protein
MNKQLWILLKENWIFVVVIGQFIVTFGVLQTVVKDHDARIKTLETEKVASALSISEINSRLASIETSLIFIKEAVRK